MKSHGVSRQSGLSPIYCCAGWENRLRLKTLPSQCFGLATGSRPNSAEFGLCALRRSILPSSTKKPFVFFVRDGRIELPPSVWKTDVLPLN